MSKVRFAIEELKFVKSRQDAVNLYEKFIYLLPRVMGLPYHKTRVPPSLQIEPGSVCNIACTCCSVERSTRKRGFMNVDLFQRIISQSASIGVRRIHLYLHGEPLLHPRFPEMVLNIKSRGLALHITTNGMRLDYSLIEKITAAGLTSADHIIVSILANSSVLHEQIMKGVNHERVVRNIEALLEHRKKLEQTDP